MDDIPLSKKQKILIIRLSSIGDIVLTSPVVRAIKQQLPYAEVHFLLKKQFQGVMENNPYISKIHHYLGKKATLTTLQNEHFDYVVDLQHNLRSKQIVKGLRVAHSRLHKLNVKKWLLVNLKIHAMPNIHIVDRYFNAVKTLQVVNDNQGLDFFIPKTEEVDTGDFPAVFEDGFVAVALGGAHQTKRIPLEKVVEICRILYKPVILLGGNDVAEMGDEIENRLGDRVYNACGKFSLNESASILKHCDCLLTGDTGMMHIGAALNVPIASLWGNTVPEFGMYPYMRDRNMFRLFEVHALKCRPCSKLGYKKCPHKHFKCMNGIEAQEVADWINSL